MFSDVIFGDMPFSDLKDSFNYPNILFRKDLRVEYAAPYTYKDLDVNYSIIGMMQKDLDIQYQLFNAIQFDIELKWYVQGDNEPVVVKNKVCSTKPSNSIKIC